MSHDTRAPRQHVSTTGGEGSKHKDIHVQAVNAWSGVVDAFEAEYRCRTNLSEETQRHKLVDDPISAAWLSQSKTQFISAWKHMANIEDPERLRKDYASVLINDEKSIQRALQALAVDIVALQHIFRSLEGRERFAEVYKAVEGILIACLGHFWPNARRRAIRLLNILYDGVNWQLDSPFQPIICTTEDSFEINVSVSSACRGNEDFRFLVCAPSFNMNSPRSNMVTIHSPTYKRELESRTDLQLRLPMFPRCGFYDWRIVRVSEEGDISTVYLPAEDDGSAPGGNSMTLGGIAQGRYIVHPASLRSDYYHEVIVDDVGMKIDYETGEVSEHGTFENVRNQLPEWRSEGYTGLLLVGAQERDNGWMESDSALKRHQEQLSRMKELALSTAFYDDSANKVKRNTASLRKLGVSGGDVESVASDEKDDPEQHARIQTPVDETADAFARDQFNPGYIIHSGDHGDDEDLEEAYESLTPDQREKLRNKLANEMPTRFGYREFASRPDANPFSLVQRATPNRMLGGELEFIRLLQKANEEEIRVILPLTGGVAASRYHRQYRGLTCCTLDTSGQRVTHPGSDGNENQWEDQVLLNYRKVESWDLLVDEMEILVTEYNAGGIYLADAQSFPFIFALDCSEMFRRDVDGEMHYTPEEILFGEVVLNNNEQGYWSDAVDASEKCYKKFQEFQEQIDITSQELQDFSKSLLGPTNVGLYPNPLLVKLARHLWSINPHAGIFGECHWGRQAGLGRSGIIPHSQSLTSALAATNGREIDKMGIIHQKPKQAEFPISSLKQFFDYELATVPQGLSNLQLRSLSSSRYPYPAFVFGRTAWTAVDAMFSLPGIPMTFEQETSGQAYRMDISGSYVVNSSFQEDELKRAKKRRDRERARVAAASSKFLPHIQQQLLSDVSHSNKSSNSDTPKSETPAEESHETQASLSFLPTDPELGSNYSGHMGVGGVIPPIQTDRPTSSRQQPKQQSLYKQSFLSKGGNKEQNPRSSIPNVSSSPALHTLLSSGDRAFDEYSQYDEVRSSQEDESTEGRRERSDSSLPADVAGVGGRQFDFLDISDEAVKNEETLFTYELKRRETGSMISESRDQFNAAALLLKNILRYSPVCNSKQQAMKSWIPVEGIRLALGEGEHEQQALTKGEFSARVQKLNTYQRDLTHQIGPEFGFDLTKICEHYNHRRTLKSQYLVFHYGHAAVLRAEHRFGEHGHVFAFARILNYGDVPPNVLAQYGLSRSTHTEADEIAIVACNFNTSQSTIFVDCSELYRYLGASRHKGNNPSTVSGLQTHDSMSSLVESSQSTPADNRTLRASGSELRLEGAIWEVRDVFQSPGLDPSDATAATDLSNAGPLVAMLTSDEAAFAPTMTTLQPHSSFCWLYSRKEKEADGHGLDYSTRPPPPPGHSSASTRRNSVRTSPSDMQWLFASALLRWQSVIRLKEASVGTAIEPVSLTEAEANGFIHSERAKTEYKEIFPFQMTGEQSSEHERWIGPSETLRDDEIQRFGRHNVVYSICLSVVRSVVQKCADLSRKTTEATTHDPNDRACGFAPVPQAPRIQLDGDALEEVVQFATDRLVAALRIFVQHWGLESNDGDLTSRCLPLLRINPSSVTCGRINVNTATVLVRSALFLAAKEDFSGIHSDAGQCDPTVVMQALVRAAKGSSKNNVEEPVKQFASSILKLNNACPIVFVTPELGKWSTVGGLGVMIDELTVGLAQLGADVTVVSPYYDVDRKGRKDYLRPDGILYTGKNIGVWVGDERLEFGVHEGVVNGVRLLFLHNPLIFPKPYPGLDAWFQVRVMSAMAKATLEVLCQWELIPRVVVTNDWFTGMISAYARRPECFGTVFLETDFIHIAHNLDPSYEGRLYPKPQDGRLEPLHGLPAHLLVDPHWADIVINPTRCALLCSDTWATVSRSYKEDLLNGSPLRPLLRLAPMPFAHPNGIPVGSRLRRLSKLPVSTHEEAKTLLQRKYFGGHNVDSSFPLFAFVGRVTAQKGVHLILGIVDDLMERYSGACQFLVGGMASSTDSYGAACSQQMRELRARHPGRFWADPTAFFVDGDLVNLGADFCLMPSTFEPGGIVQQEFFVAGTPVIAFKTGGLKDTVREFNPATLYGNGFTFERHAHEDFVMAIERAIQIYHESELYQRLRRNAKSSVVDGQTVSIAWYKEFCRIRRCLPFPGFTSKSSVPTGRPLSQCPVRMLFRLGFNEIGGCHSGSDVRITGTWSNWRDPKRLQPNHANTAFELHLMLEPGTHWYKFQVDGTWAPSLGAPHEKDSEGNVNNVITVDAYPEFL
eukprot:gb/GECG01003819.1/.p1 GENE.gb/GECG01003819.1/~~gb/GECG01003819.1/.p1  ORF type:complete len:2286 (+),score=259.53 gb/GECG01003819.1/:1-6858(+)